MASHDSNPQFLEDVTENERILEDDIVIVMLGALGVGKTNFITKATGRPERNTGTFFAGTQSIEASLVRVHNDGRKRHVVLVDTPGFGDPVIPDAAILKMLQDWLGWGKKSKILISGIIYCHPITEPRMSRIAITCLDMLKSMCRGFVPLVLTTTRWDFPSDPVFHKRQADLEKEFWNEMLARSWGAANKQFKNTPESAWAIIDHIMNIQKKSEPDKPYQYTPMISIQIDRGKRLGGTDAGKLASQDIFMRRGALELKKRDLLYRLGEARAIGTAEEVAQIEGELRLLQEDKKRIKKADDGLDVPVFQRFTSFIQRTVSKPRGDGLAPASQSVA